MISRRFSTCWNELLWNIILLGAVSFCHLRYPYILLKPNFHMSGKSQTIGNIFFLFPNRPRHSRIMKTRRGRCLPLSPWVGNVWNGRKITISPMVWDFPNIWKPYFILSLYEVFWNYNVSHSFFKSLSNYNLKTLWWGIYNVSHIRSIYSCDIKLNK